MPGDEELIDGREVARRLGVSYNTLLRWRKAEKVPGVKLSKKVLRFNLRQVAEALGIAVETVVDAQAAAGVPLRKSGRESRLKGQETK